MILLSLIQSVRHSSCWSAALPRRSSFCVCGVLLLCSTMQVSSLIFSPLNFDHSSHLKRLVWAVILFTKVFVAAHKFLKYDFYCTVQVITETLNITGFRIPVAELHPLEILSLFGWESLISRFENNFFSQPYLPDGDYIKILFPSKNAMWTMTKLYCSWNIAYLLLLLSVLCLLPIKEIN